jgi:hypothetical protein
LFNGKKYHLLKAINGHDVGGININGLGTAVVGYYTAPGGAVTGFIYENNVWQPLQFPGGYNTASQSVNNANEVVGTFLTVGGVGHGFTWTP